MPNIEFDPTRDPTRHRYEQLADHLAGLIEAGQLRPNYPLPSEGRLAEEYGVSRGTARHARQLLMDRGLVVPVRSKGTYVKARDNHPVGM